MGVGKYPFYMSRPEAYVYFECRPNKKCFCGWDSMDLQIPPAGSIAGGFNPRPSQENGIFGILNDVLELCQLRICDMCVGKYPFYMSRPEAYVYFECRPNKKCFCGWVSMDLQIPPDGSIAGGFNPRPSQENVISPYKGQGICFGEKVRGEMVGQISIFYVQPRSLFILSVDQMEYYFADGVQCIYNRISCEQRP